MNKVNDFSTLGNIEEFLVKKGFNKNFVVTLMRYIREWRERDFLRTYQEWLSLWAEHLQDTKQKVIVTLDGRDTAGKWSNIRRLTEQLNTRKSDIVAFPWIPKPNERSKGDWLHRYENEFPEEWRITFFDRSWYNRAIVEPVMGFCNEEEYEWFLTNVNKFEKEHIIDEGYDFLKIWLSIGKDVQKRRLEEREWILKKWKSSSVDQQAQAKWKLYTKAKEQVLLRTDTEIAPWIILDSTQRYLSAVEIIKAIISTREDVRKIAERTLSIDLTPNSKIRRTWAQELEKMREEWQIPVDKEFPFLQESV